MPTDFFEIPTEQIDLSREEIEIILGYNSGSPEPFPMYLDEFLHNIDDFCQLRGGYRVISTPAFDQENKTITLEGIKFDVEKVVFHQLRKAEKMAVFACTAGENIEKHSRTLMKTGDMLAGYILDVIGSLAVEKAMDIIQENLKQKLSKEELKITNRYSPGYCEWNVNEQHKLFSLLPENFCGIKLSSTALMHPIKSVSGFIGIGKEVNFNNYTCKFCNSKNCIYRKLNAV
ncbi:MAG: vitamin B12 dependent-methionine synthase activation domain-containing protein [Bacteroidota bacterium]